MGAAPSPMKPIPILSAMSLTWLKCVFTSWQVSCILPKGAPDSSSCPPGSNETFAPSFTSPMMLPASKIGSQSYLSFKPINIDFTDFGPSYGMGFKLSLQKPNFSCSVPTFQSDLGLHPSDR